MVVAKKIPDALTRVEVEAPVKKEADTLAGAKAFPCLETLNKVKAPALVNTQARTFRQVYAQSVTNTLSDIKAETPVETLTDGSKGDGRDAGRYNGQCRGKGTC